MKIDRLVNELLFQHILKATVTWMKEAGLPKWHVLLDGKKYELTMNNFPEEPLYTLECEGVRLDLDDLPSDWLLPRH